LYGEVGGDYWEEAWASHQLHLLRDLVPARRASLRELLSSEEPSVETRSGGRHRFLRRDLEDAASILPVILWDAPVFPIVFTLGEVEGVYLVGGGQAAEVFSRLVGVRGLGRLENGEFYAYKSLVLHFLSRFPTLGVIIG